MSLHSGGEMGIFTACHLQVASAEIGYAIDRVYYLLADDVIDKRFEVRDRDAVGTRRSRTGAQASTSRSSSTKPDGTGVRKGDLVW
jgi:hypothetical protein